MPGELSPGSAELDAGVEGSGRALILLCVLTAREITKSNFVDYPVKESKQKLTRDGA